jgi:hypothetical protein
MIHNFLTFLSVFLTAGVAVIVVYIIVYKPIAAEVQVFLLGLLFKIAFTYYYFNFTLTASADAYGYYTFASSTELGFALLGWTHPGTDFVQVVATLFYPLVSFFDNPYLMLFIPFSLLGFIGTLLFYRTLRHVAPLKKRNEIYLLCFFMPNLIYWTSNIGKDSLVYFGIALVMYGFEARPRFPRNILLIIGGAFVVYMVRPHVIMFMLFGFLLGLFFEKRKLSFRSVAVFAFALGAFLVLHGKIFDIAGVYVDEGGENKSSLGAYYSAGVSRVEASSQTLNIGESATGSSHGFSAVLFPYYIFRFLTSPFLWEARKPIHIVSALETIIYQIMIVYLCIHWKDVRKIDFIPFKYSWLIYLLVSSIIGGASQSNFGLIVRERCMALPVILLYFAALRYYLSINPTRKLPTTTGAYDKANVGTTRFVSSKTRT